MSQKRPPAGCLWLNLKCRYGLLEKEFEVHSQTANPWHFVSFASFCSNFCCEREAFSLTTECSRRTCRIDLGILEQKHAKDTKTGQSESSQVPELTSDVADKSLLWHFEQSQISNLRFQKML